MKIQCSCGAKYAFDVTPDMVENPVQLVCTSCGTDLSSFVNELIRQERPPAEPIAVEPEVAPAPPVVAPPGLRVRTHDATREAEPAAGASDEMPVCLKHPPNRTTHRCYVCQKPICPECMAFFGYVCSPHCKAKATANGIKLPVYKGERSYIEARRWRKAGWAAAGIAVLLAGLLGGWIWYEFAGRLPHPYFSVAFAERARSGEAAFCGDDQMVFLHGATLARCDLKRKTEVWSRELISKADVGSPPGGSSSGDPAARLAWAATGLHLRVSGRNVWIIAPEKMTRYDWDTGEPKQEIPLAGGEAVSQGDEVLLVGREPGGRSIEHISLATGETRMEEINEPAAAGQPHPAILATTKSLRRPPAAGLAERAPGQNPAAPLDPAEAATHFQGLSTPARIALPAVLANAGEQERLNAEMNDQDGIRPPPANNPLPTETLSLIPLPDGCLQFSVRLLERRTVVRSAMKDRPAKSALDGNVTSGDTAAVANELLNEMQRDRGGDKVTEDHSRYRVTLRRADAKVSSEWTGEVDGPPGLIPLGTVNVLASGNILRVFDKANKKLWEATLAFNLPLERYASADESLTGAGPCVERNGILYVADEGVLTAFDLADGNVRWRLPTVGIAGMFFDDHGMIYVNTTTANPETIKYSRQIDLAQKADPVVLKIDPRSGKTLWSTKPGGYINYLSGKYVYVVTSYPGDFDENGEPYGVETGLEKSASLHIRRLDPEDGHEIWTCFQPRCPLDVKFDRNKILLVFRKEVQVLKFLEF